MDVRFAAAAAVPLAAAALALSLYAAVSGEPLPGELWLARRVQDTPGGDALEKLAAWTHAVRYPALVAGALVAARMRRANLVIAAAIVLAALALNPLVKELVSRDRPLPAEVVLREDADGYGYPSGHVHSVVLLFGYFAVVMAAALPRPWATAVAVASAAGVAFVGWERVYDGAHWPTDVAGSVAIGGAALFTAFPLAGMLASLGRGARQASRSGA